MGDQTLGARERILAAAIDLLQQEGASRVTVRRVADRAGVGIGLINYHFGSKDQLMFDAVSRIIGGSAASWYKSFSHPDVAPETRFRQLLRESGRMMDKFPNLFQFSLEHEIMEGEFELPQSILPLLREIFGDEKRDLELRLIAFSQIVSMQVALLRPEAFRRFSGLDLFDRDQRELMMDLLVNNLLAQRASAVER